MNRSRRNPSSSSGSVGRRTPDRFSQSPSYSSSSSSHRSTTSAGNPVKVAARTVAGAFAACFAPPDSKDSTHFDDSDSFKPPSGTGSERRRNSNQNIYAHPNNSTHMKEPGSVKFTIEEIIKATKNFSLSLKIGQGGFGTVYKGRLGDGTLVAVKRAKKVESVYDKHLGTEFQSEVQTLAKVEHLNLVKFYGFLEHGEERIVVVEYVSNGTLREHLDCINGNVLNLPKRLDIAIDVAHAITYLHTYTGRRPIEPTRELKERITARWAVKKFTEGDAILILDPRLERSAANSMIAERILELALLCLAPHRHSRPAMRKCTEILWSIRKDLSDPNIC
nr:calmodulin-binding receptor-like cytoplasmic kinase 2 [Ipomoea trifida]